MSYAFKRIQEKYYVFYILLLAHVHEAYEFLNVSKSLYRLEKLIFLCLPHLLVWFDPGVHFSLQYICFQKVKPGPSKDPRNTQVGKLL